MSNLKKTTVTVLILVVVVILAGLYYNYRASRIPVDTAHSGVDGDVSSQLSDSSGPVGGGAQGGGGQGGGGGASPTMFDWRFWFDREP